MGDHGSHTHAILDGAALAEDSHGCLQLYPTKQILLALHAI